MRPMRTVLLVVLLVTLANGMPEKGHYYVDIPCEDHTEQGLYELIGDSVFTVPYLVNVFDCSERTAYFDWFLTSHGFNTYICVTKNRALNHCWLAVKVDIPNSSSQDIVYVETTTSIVQIVNRNHPEYGSYQDEATHYDDIFKFREDFEESEMDWWANITDIPMNLTFTVKVNNSLHPISWERFPSLTHGVKG